MRGNTLVYLTYVVLACSVVRCTWNFRRLRLEFRWLALYIFLSAGVQAGAELLSRWNINNLFLSHVYAILGFAVLSAFYWRVLRPFVPGALFGSLVAGFVLLAVVTAIFWEPLHTFNSIPLTAEAVVFIIFAMSTFILTLNESLNQHVRPILRSLNWINSGILLYFSASLLLFYNGEAIIHIISGRWSVYTWLIHGVLYIVLHSCLFIGLWWSPKT
jgi:hypothetical protein